MRKGLSLIILSYLALPPLLHSEVIAIRAGSVLDPEAGTTSMNTIVLVEDGRIKAIGAGLAVPPGATVIDLAGSTLLPGLFDCHTHVCLTMEIPAKGGARPIFQSLLVTSVTRSTGYRALQGLANAQSMLRSGFTTIRDLGNAGNYADVDLRRAIEDGLVSGPTIINAGRIIVPYGGQFPGLISPERRDLGEPEYFYADTRDELLRAVRENIYYGAKVIKVVVDDQPYIYSADDLRLVVDEAAKAGLKVAAHCVTRAGAHNATVAGVASIEHGSAISDEDIEVARTNHVVLVNLPTAVLRRAHASGAVIAFGTDESFGMPGVTRGEKAMAFIDIFAKAGLSAGATLQAMTSTAARLLGVDKDRGAIRPGMAADLIATPRNPMDDIATLKQVSFVMKDGRVIRP